MKKYISLALALTLLVSYSLATAPQAVAEQGLVKDETVFANLNADGSPSTIYVVNRIETPANEVYLDYGDYTTIVNLSGSEKPGVSGDEISWQQEGKVLYYQGQLEQGELPFTLKLEYKLNTAQADPQEIIGKSGKISIAIKVRPNPRAKQYFRENYVAQIQIPLDLTNASNIKAPGATSVVAGKTATLAYTILPGQEVDYLLEFETSKFELDSISMSCIPFDTASYLDIDTDEMKDGFYQLADGLDQLASGSNQLKDGLGEFSGALGQLANGANQLAAGSGKLANNIPALLAGISKLKEGAMGLDGGLDQINQGVTGLTGGLSGLAGGIGNYISGAGQIRDNAQQISGGLNQLDSQGATLNAGYGQLTQGLQEAIAGLPAQLAPLQLTPEQQQALEQMLGQLVGELNGQLAGFGQGLQNYTGGVSQVAGGCGQLANGLGLFVDEGQGLKAGADQLAEAGNGLSQGLGNLKTGSSQLASGLITFAEESKGLSGGADELVTGTASLANGLNQLAGGAKELPEHAAALAAAQQRLKDGFAEAVAGLADFELPQSGAEPVSFVSDKVSPRSVQFVASTPALKVKATASQLPAEEKDNSNFFTRLLKLFGIK